ncbi:hypothetical protein PENTCL1PPCAC_28239, partial [Pristionchus entomophagus]
FHFKNTCQILMFFSIVFMLTSALCALLGSSVKFSSFLVPAIAVQFLNVLVTSAVIGFSFVSDQKFKDNHPLLFECTIVSAVINTISLFVFLLSYCCFRSIVRQVKKY